MVTGLRDTDRGYKKFLEDLLQQNTPKISVGILAAQGAEEHKNAESESGEKLTVLDVAIKNEFGLGVPARSFIGAWFDLNSETVVKEANILFKLVLEGKYTKWQAFEIIGQRAVGGIQKRIADGIAPANSPLTIALKGSSKPLIDTGQLRSSITYLVEGVKK